MRGSRSSFTRVVAVLALSLPTAAAGVSLDSFNVDPVATTVSGVSAGGYMANQFHVAFSATVAGTGIIAAGPFYCAKGNLATALTDCTTPTALDPPDTGYSIRVTDDYASRGEIDNTSFLHASKVWIFSGTKDTTVYPVVVDRLVEYYRHYVDPSNIVYVNTVAAAHSMVTDDYGHACDHAGDANNAADVFINDCDYSAAGKLFAHLYGPLHAPATVLSGSIVAFDQGEFIADPTSHSMNPTGYAYVPAACDDGAICRIHVAFHGCLQYPSRIGDAFYRHAGYNKWADSNKIIVLYPQTTASDLPPVYNPRGCWDWWGYDDANYAKQSGRQMQAIKRMVDRVAAGYVASPPSAPTSLTASTRDDHGVALRWNPSAGPRLAAYNVYYATSADGPFARAGSTGDTHAMITGLQSGTTYHFTVRAESRRHAESASSNVAFAATSGLPTLPSALTPIVALVP